MLQFNIGQKQFKDILSYLYITMRTCKKCQLIKSLENFTTGKYTCKDCRNVKYRDGKLKEFIKSRVSIRNEFLRDFIDKGKESWTLESFNNMFIKHEDFLEMEKNIYEYKFVKYEQFRDFIPIDDYKNGYILNCVLCDKSPNNLNNILFII